MYGKMPPKSIVIGFAILAALLYSISSPAAKLLLTDIPPALLAALLYLGAGLGMTGIHLLRREEIAPQEKLSRTDLPYILGMIILDIAAPLLLMFGLTMTTAANASLLNNFEIVTTSVIALLIFHEAITRRLWIAILLIVGASILLTIENAGSLSFSPGSVLILLACGAWGFENNCTRMLSRKNPVEIVMIKGLGSGTGAFLIAIAIGEVTGTLPGIGAALLLGFFAYGLSIYFYVTAQRYLGAARTSAFYAVAPFMGVGLSMILFATPLTASFLLATVIMILGAYIAATGGHRHRHIHTPLTHKHSHSHDDGHHTHSHPHPPIHTPGTPDPIVHSHIHTHEAVTHTHPHSSDLHHTHGHHDRDA